jgi:putative sterol carrier protein
MDANLKKRLAEKIEDSEFGVGDIADYLVLFAAVGNENDDVKDEVEGWNRVVVLQLQDSDAYWIKVVDGTFTTGTGSPEGADVVLRAKGATIAAILCGDKDATMAYTTGSLKIDGKLSDAVKMRSLIGAVREVIED